MNRLLAATIVVTALTVSFASAQESTPKVQAFGGYSLVENDTGKLNGAMLDFVLREQNSPFDVTSSFRGWNAEGQYNANRWLGIVADVGGRYGTPIKASRGVRLTGLPNGTGYSVLAGPVVSYRGRSRVELFVHALFGIDRYTLNGSTITGVSTPVSSSATTFTDFAASVGGGIDVRLSRHFGLRLGQLDYLETTHNLNKFYDSVFNTPLFEGLRTRQRNVRFSAGVSARF